MCLSILPLYNFIHNFLRVFTEYTNNKYKLCSYYATNIVVIQEFLVFPEMDSQFLNS